MAGIGDRYRRVEHCADWLLVFVGMERECQAAVEESERRLQQSRKLAFALVFGAGEIVVFYVGEKRDASSSFCGSSISTDVEPSFRLK